MSSLLRTFAALGALSSGLAVLLGAFGAHALEARLSVELLETYQTANFYHFIHSLTLFLPYLVADGAPLVADRAPQEAEKTPPRLLLWCAWCFLAGTVLFSGSLYILALTGYTALGILTPFGGLTFLIAWSMLAVALFKPL